MAVIDEDNFDDSVIELVADLWDLPVFEGQPSFLPIVVGYPSLDDATWALDVNGVKTWATTNSFAYKSRLRFAYFGHKPDETWSRAGYPVTMRFSRVQDLEDIDDLRGEFTLDERITSHVVPYVLDTIETTGAVDYDFAADTPPGTLLPHPWPRVLNAYRIVNSDTGKVHWPRGTVNESGDDDIPEFDRIDENGTAQWPRSKDPGITPSNGVVALGASTTYTVEIGHVEGADDEAQRWPTDALPSTA